MSKHLFACYVPTLSEQYHQQSPKHLTLRCPDLYQRITKVLRLAAGDMCLLFDTQHIISVLFDEESFSRKNTINAHVKQIKPNQPLTPPITLYLGLTKKKAFQEALYATAALGVTKIVPCLTQKIHKNWLEKKDLARLEAIMIAACEQAKSFCLPKLAPIQTLESIKPTAQARVLFEKESEYTLKQLCSTGKLTSFALAIGPEGGFTDLEQTQLKEKNFTGCRLTPTTLRSQDAIWVGVGCLQTLLMQDDHSFSS